MTCPALMMTAPTGTSPTSHALWAWSSAMRMALSSAGVLVTSVSSLLGGFIAGSALLQGLVHIIRHALLKLLRLGTNGARSRRNGRRVAARLRRRHGSAQVADCLQLLLGRNADDGQHDQQRDDAEEGSHH